jgi:hypothetical protein
VSVKLMSAMAYDLQTREETGLPDPVLVVRGELPGAARPFGIHRVYKGAQGVYEEVLVLADPDGYVLWESRPRNIELRGEMFEDLFRRTIEDRIEISDTREHSLGFYLDGRLVGRVPTFVEAPDSARHAGVLLEASETALKKGSIMWVTIPQRDGTSVSRPAWYVQQGSKLFVLTGEREQHLPNIEHCDVVRLTVKSKDINAAIGEMDADVRLVDDAEEFERIAGLGLGERLNLPDGQDALQRWVDTCKLVELTPHS